MSEAVGAADARFARCAGRGAGMTQGRGEFVVFDRVRHRGVAHAELQVEARFETAGHGGEHEQGFALFAERGRRVQVARLGVEQDGFDNGGEVGLAGAVRALVGAADAFEIGRRGIAGDQVLDQASTEEGGRCWGEASCLCRRRKCGERPSAVASSGGYATPRMVFAPQLWWDSDMV